MKCFTTYPFTIFSKSLNERYPVSEFYPCKGDTIVGNDVLIGMNVTIMPGVHIGDGAIIGTNSLVTKDVEPYSIFGGNTAKIIKKRFTDDVIDVLFSNDIKRLTNLMSYVDFCRLFCIRGTCGV
jgi:virginiamycin A acetyltransferase